MEYIKLGTNNMGIPRHKATIALIINKVFNFMAVLLFYIFSEKIFILSVSELIIRLIKLVIKFTPILNPSQFNFNL